jgi:hypothetical protein
LFLFFAGNVAIIVAVSVKGLMRGRKLKKYKQRRESILSTRKSNIQMLQSAHIMNGLMHYDKQRYVYDNNREVYEQEIQFVKNISNMELRNLLNDDKQQQEDIKMLYYGAEFPTSGLPNFEPNDEDADVRLYVKELTESKAKTDLLSRVKSKISGWIKQFSSREHEYEPARTKYITDSNLDVTRQDKEQD